MIVKGKILLIVIREKRLCNFGWYNEFSPVSDWSRAEGGHRRQSRGGWSESATAQSATCHKAGNRQNKTNIDGKNELWYAITNNKVTFDADDESIIQSVIQSELPNRHLRQR